MTTQITHVQSTNQIHKSHLEPRSSIFEVLNFFTLHIMGKPNKLASAVLLGAFATGAQAKEGELRLASLGNESSNVATQFEGESAHQRQVETLATDYETVIAQLILQRDNLNCKIIEDFDTQMECEGKFDTFESQIRLTKKQQKGSELAQSVDKKQDVKTELTKEETTLDKTISKQKLSIAALEALKKVKANMQSE